METTFEAAVEILSGSDAEFIAIAGGTGSGKSYLSNILAKKLDARVIEMDDYYKGREYVEKYLDGNFDHPDGVDIALLAENLSGLRRKEAVQKPFYSMDISGRGGYETVEPGGVFVVNGLFALDEKLVPLFDLRVFLKAEKETLHRRRLERNAAEGRRMLGDDYFERVAWPMHQEYIAPAEKRADLVVLND